MTAGVAPVPAGPVEAAEGASGLPTGQLDMFDQAPEARVVYGTIVVCKGNKGWFRKKGLPTSAGVVTPAERPHGANS